MSNTLNKQTENMYTLYLAPAGLRLPSRSLAGAIFFVLLWLSGCTGKKDLDFAPSVDPKATYSFKLSPPSGSGAQQYLLTGITQVAAKTNPEADTWDYCTFMLKGKDKATQAEVYITGKTNTYDAYINIVVTQGGNTTFYKDCNSFRCQVDTGTDTRGKFVRLSNFTSPCVTTTLDSERRMDIIQYYAQLNPLTFYIQED
jgi:hypothetical protein